MSITQDGDRHSPILPIHLLAGLGKAMIHTRTAPFALNPPGQQAVQISVNHLPFFVLLLSFSTSKRHAITNTRDTSAGRFGILASMT